MPPGAGRVIRSAGNIDHLKCLKLLALICSLAQNVRLDEHNIILKGQNFTSSLRGVRGEEVNYGSVCLRHPGGRVELLLIRQYML